MCTKKDNAGPCYSDDGGPLYDSENNVLLVGFVSWSHSCGNSSVPAIYTKISSQVSDAYTFKK